MTNEKQKIIVYEKIRNILEKTITIEFSNLACIIMETTGYSANFVKRYLLILQQKGDIRFSYGKDGIGAVEYVKNARKNNNNSKDQPSDY